MFTHRTVLLTETVSAVLGPLDGRYVDGTFGRGGHTRLLLSKLAPTAAVLGIDKDPQAVAEGQRLAAEDARFTIARGSFAELPVLVAAQGWAGLDGVILDLGVSSPQLDDAERGFSFMNDGPLDMRMDPERGESAAAWLAHVAEATLADVLHEYGEERYARRIARAIVAARREAPITRTAQLAEIIKVAHPAWERGKHPATRSFQAIRIQINSELGDLDRLLAQVLDVLRPGGRLAVITFHSLEDRLVKRFFQRMCKGEELPRHLPIRASEFQPRLKLVGKAIEPSEQEVQDNPRARSARLRVAERVGAH